MKRILAMAVSFAIVLASVPAFAADRGTTQGNPDGAMGSSYQARETNRYQHENSPGGEYGTRERTMARQERRIGAGMERGFNQWGFGGPGRGMGGGSMMGGFGHGAGGHGGHR